jgi:hypothetical protein
MVGEVLKLAGVASSVLLGFSSVSAVTWGVVSGGVILLCQEVPKKKPPMMSATYKRNFKNFMNVFFIAKLRKGQIIKC